jgi:hypothetical protein
LKNTFELSKFDEYREDNRREVKKAEGGLPVSLWDTYSSFANCYGGVIMVIYVPMAKREQKSVYINNDIFNGTFRRIS